MSQPALSSTANTLDALVSAVASLADRDSSLTIWMFQDSWSVGVDTGDSVDDDIEWEGPNLPEVLQLTLKDVEKRPQTTNASDVAESTKREDFTAVLTLLDACRTRLTDYPLDIAYVPHSQVSPSAPWEVNLTHEGETEIWMEATALRALSGAARILGVSAPETS